MPFHCISPQEKWMENPNLRLGRSGHMKCIDVFPWGAWPRDAAVDTHK